MENSIPQRLPNETELDFRRRLQWERSSAGRAAVLHFYDVALPLIAEIAARESAVVAEVLRDVVGVPKVVELSIIGSGVPTVAKEITGTSQGGEAFAIAVRVQAATGDITLATPDTLPYSLNVTGRYSAPGAASNRTDEWTKHVVRSIDRATIDHDALRALLLRTAGLRVI